MTPVRRSPLPAAPPTPDLQPPAAEQPVAEQPTTDSQPAPALNAFSVVWQNPYVRAPVFLLLGAASMWLLLKLSHVLLLAVTAYSVAYLFQPLLNTLARRRLPKLPGVLLVVLSALGMLVLTSALLIGAVQTLGDLVADLPAVTQRGLDWAARLARTHPLLQGPLHALNAQTGHGTQLVQAYLLPSLLPYLQSHQGSLLSGTLSLLGGVAETAVTLILSVYMMLDYSKVSLTLLRLFPRPWQPLVLDVSADVSRAVGGYLKGQLLIAGFVGVFVGVGLTLAGIPNGAAIGLVAALFNIVPYLGVVVSILPALLLAATLPAALVKMGVVILIFAAANQVESALLAPMVLAKTTDLHPATVLLAVLCGLALFGLPGALIAVPLAALVKLLLAGYYYGSRVYQAGP